MLVYNVESIEMDEEDNTILELGNGGTIYAGEDAVVVANGDGSVEIVDAEEEEEEEEEEE